MCALRIGVADTIFPDLKPVEAVFAGQEALMRIAATPSPDDILAVARDADAVFVTFAKLTGEIISQFENCKAIGRFGIGVDNIDIKTATERGIVVTYVPDYCLDEVSDHAMALMLDLARKTSFADRTVREGRWEMPAVVPINRLRGQTLGLVGLGKIPQTLVPKAQAFGLSVIASDPYVAPDAARKLGVTLVSFDEMLERSDFISVHAPLTKETHHLFNAEAFGKMKPNAILVNTARGPLVDDQALAAALDAGRIAGAGLDVLPIEPIPADYPLNGRPNVVITPHTGFYSEQALLELQTKCAKDVASVLKGERPVYPVNPEVLDRR